MKRPQEYVDLMDQFMGLEDQKKVVKLLNASREDVACLTMVAYCKELPIEVRANWKEKVVILLRKEDD